MDDGVIVVKRGRGRPKGSKNKQKKEIQTEVIEEVKKPKKIHGIYQYTGPSSYKNAGRRKGSLNKSTLEKIAKNEMLDPRIYPPVRYKKPGRPKETFQYKKEKAYRESLLHPSEEHIVEVKKRKKDLQAEELERCKQYAFDWCYKHNAELYKYSEQLFVFRYRNDPTRRRYQLSYDYGDYPMIWLPYTDSHATQIEM